MEEKRKARGGVWYPPEGSFSIRHRDGRVRNGYDGMLAALAACSELGPGWYLVAPKSEGKGLNPDRFEAARKGAREYHARKANGDKAGVPMRQESRLAKERMAAGLSRQDVADLLAVKAESVRKWEQERVGDKREQELLALYQKARHETI